jgi:hypothetical protein
MPIPGYLSVPFQNGYPHIGRLQNSKTQDPLFRTFMNNESNESYSFPYRALSVTTNNVTKVADFYNQYQKNTISSSYAPYPSTAPYVMDLTKLFIAPIQYALMADEGGNINTIYSVMLEPYDWNESFTNWNAIGVLGTFTPQVTASPIPIPASATPDNQKGYTIECYLQNYLENGASFSCDATTSNFGTLTYVINSISSYQNGTQYYLTPTQGVSASTGYYYEMQLTTTKNTLTLCNVDQNGYLYSIVSGITYYLCLYEKTEGVYELVQIAISTIPNSTQKITIDGTQYGFSCPMWSLIFKYFS